MKTTKLIGAVLALLVVLCSVASAEEKKAEKAKPQTSRVQNLLADWESYRPVAQGEKRSAADDLREIKKISDETAAVPEKLATAVNHVLSLISRLNTVSESLTGLGQTEKLMTDGLTELGQKLAAGESERDKTKTILGENKDKLDSLKKEIDESKETAKKLLDDIAKFKAEQQPPAPPAEEKK